MVVMSLLGVLIGGLVLLYLTRPYYHEFTLSAARFFEDTPGDSDAAVRLRLDSLLLSRPFYLQLAVLLLLLVASALTQCSRPVAAEQETVGVWVMLDTSASMSTLQGNQTRWEIAAAEIDMLHSHLDDLESEVAHCVNLATFDLAVRGHSSVQTSGQLQTAIADLEPGLLGTDLNLIRSLANQSEDDEAPCPITHLVVLSDMPTPDWLADLTTDIALIWRDVAEPVANVGITRVSGGGSALVGSGDVIDIEVTTYHTAPDTVTVTVVDESGTLVHSESFTPQQTGVLNTRFLPTASGTYTISVSPGGNYAHDDTVTIAVDVMQQIRVDWQVANTALRDLLDWQQSANEPHLRVTTLPISTDDVPTLFVGDQYGKGTTAAEIGFFDEKSPLLADVNLDVLETLPVQGVPLSAETGLQSVLYNIHDGVWLAARSDPPAAYIPGLPTGIPQSGDDPNLDAVSATLFFNAVRFLLEERTPQPLYTLTTPQDPQPTGNRGTLHPGEGNTARTPHSTGDFADIEPVSAETGAEPVWPLLLAMATVIFAVERGLLAHGGPRWR